MDLPTQPSSCTFTAQPVSPPRLKGLAGTLGAAVLWCVLGQGVVHAESVTLNLKEADIASVIGTVSEITGRNFIVDPRVKGKVTIISSRPMETDEVYQVFLSVLAVHGFAAVESGRVIKIIPDANAKQEPVPVYPSGREDGNDQFVTRVVELNHVSAQQLVPILRPLVDQKGHLAAYPQSNVLIFSDRQANINRLVKIIQRIDVPSGSEIEIIPLEHASATEVVRILTTFQQQEQRAERGAAKSESQNVLIADERTNSVLLGGDKSERLRLRAIISHLDTPLETGGNIQVVYLRYAQAKDLVPVLTDIGRAAGAGGAAPRAPGTPASGTDFTLRADESSNALVITAPPELFRTLEGVIKKLDVRRAQVLVEAIIAEMTSQRAAELGVQWIVDGTPSGEGPVGVINFATGGAGSSIGEVAGAAVSGTVSSVPSGLTIGLGNFDSTTVNLAVLLRALEADGATNVLSTPTLVTMDNVEAEINVGQEVPFVTGSFTSTGAGGASSTPTNPFQTIQRKTVGLNLKVKPLINEGNAIRLDIHQTVDSLSAAAGAVDLITNTRSIKTSVMVDDGQVVVLGGLITDDLSETAQKVPFLGDLPILGQLFRYSKRTKNKTNLMVFLRPVILRDAAITEQVSHSKYTLIRDTQLTLRQRGVTLLTDEASPLLPPVEDVMMLPPPFDGEAAPPSDDAPDGAGRRSEHPNALVPSGAVQDPESMEKPPALQAVDLQM